MRTNNDTKLRDSLKQIQLRVQVACDRTFTHEDLAELAGVTSRSLGDWMRGVTAPTGMSAVFELLACLPDQDAIAVLRYWKSHTNRIAPLGKKRKSTSVDKVKAKDRIGSSHAISSSAFKE